MSQINPSPSGSSPHQEETKTDIYAKWAARIVYTGRPPETVFIHKWPGRDPELCNKMEERVLLLTMDLVKGRPSVKRKVISHQLLWMDVYIMFPGCNALEVTPWGESRRWSSLLKRMLHSLARLYASMDQYCCLAGESKSKSTFPPESNRSVNLKGRSSTLRLWLCVCDSRQMCGTACTLNKHGTTPATKLLSSRCLTRPLKHDTTQWVGAQHHNSFKIQMWEAKRTPPAGERESGRKRHASTHRKTPLQINPVIRKRPIKVSPGLLISILQACWLLFTVATSPLG